MTRLLVIEDNLQIANNIKEYLELEPEREVSLASDGEKGLAMAKHQEYDLILLDLMLPKISWEQLIKSLRIEKSLPIIVITAKGQLEDKLELFKLGADDYLVKPFDLSELLARVKALLRRGVRPQVFQWKDLSIDFSRKEIKKADSVIHLTLKEFQLLELLVQNQWRSLSRTEILEELRGEDSVWEWDGKLDVYVANLRKKLDKRLIETVKGFGYTLRS